MNVDVSELDQVVTLQRQVETDDGHGGREVSWADIRKEHAAVRPMTSGERVASERVEGTAGYTVIIRARRDFSEVDRLVWNGREMNIRGAPARAPRSLYMKLECELGVAI